MRRIVFLMFLLLSVGCITAQQRIDLSGQWQIKLDPANVGTNEKWFMGSFNEYLNLPGSLQEQGFGKDIDVHTKWTGKIAPKVKEPYLCNYTHRMAGR